MPVRSPSPELLQLGRGIIRLAPHVDGVRLPFRDLGNCETLTVTTADTKLTKNSSRSGLATIYKELTQERVVTINITGDEFDGDTLAAILAGEVTDVAATVGAPVVDESHELGGKQYGSIKTTHPLISAVSVAQAKATAAAAVADGGNTGDATIDSVVTHVGSGAEIITIAATVTGADGVGEATVTGSVSGLLGTAIVGTLFESAVIDLRIVDGATTPLTAGDSYTIDLTAGTVVRTVADDYTIEDAARGLIGIVEGGAIDADAPILVSYTYASRAATRKIEGGTLNTQEATIMFAADNAAGPNWDATFFRVSLTPEGPLGLISQEFGTWALTAKLLDDSAGDFGGSAASPLYKLEEKPVAA